MKRSLLALAAGLLALGLLLWATGVWQPLGDGAERAAPGMAEPVRSVEAPGETPAAPPTLAGREAEPKAAGPRAEPTGPRVTGRVVDDTGKPVAGARVIAAGDTYATPFAVEEAGKEGVGTRVASTDGEGRFAVSVPADAPFHQVWADAQGLGFALRVNVPSGADVVLTLERPVAVVGTVKDGEGAPLAGATVTAWVLLDCRKIEAQGVSGPDGAYRIEGLPGGLRRPGQAWRPYFLSSWFEVRAEGYAPLLVEGVLDAAAPPEHRQDFTLLRGATLVGHVEDGESGKPVAGATVALHSIEGMQGFGRGNGARYSSPWAPRLLATTTSGEDGSFRFEHVPCLGPHGSASHNASPSGRKTLGGVTAWSTATGAASETVDLGKDGERLEVTLKLWPAAVVLGRVVEPDGTPRGNVTVVVSVGNRGRPAWVPPFLQGVPRPQAVSEEGTGRFRIDGAPAASEGPVEVTVNLYRRDRSRRAAGSQGAGTAKVTVEAGQTVDLGDVVLDPLDLLPVTTVVVKKPDGTPCFGAQVARGHMSDAPRTDAAGRAEWVWGRPRPGQALPEVAVIVRAPGFAPTPATLFPPGSGKEEVQVTLLPAHRLAGTVLEADGSPAVGLSVQVGDGAANVTDLFPERMPAFVSSDALPQGRTLPYLYGWANTDEQGRFAFEDLPDGPYHVRASRPRRVPTAEMADPLRAQASGVAADRDDLLLRLPVDDSPEAGTLEGTVVDAETGRAVIARSVRVMSGNRLAGVAYPPRSFGSPIPPAVGVIRPDGSFDVKNLAVGTYAVHVEAEEFRPAVVSDVVIRAGQTTRLPPVRLGRGTAVVGRVSAPGVPDYSSYGIWLRADGKAGARANLGKDGSFRVTGLEPGPWMAVVSVQNAFGPAGPPPLIPAGGETVTLREGDAEVRFDVTWAAAGQLSLAPTDPRLPPSGPGAAPGTPEQEEFAAGCRITLRGPDGQVLLDQTGGLQNGSAGARSWFWLLPGRYVARLELPGGEVREETVDLTAGATLRLMLRGK